MKLKNLTTIGIALIVVAGVSAIVMAQGAPTVSGTMTLSMSDGACVKTLAGNDGGDRIKAKRNGSVRWNVTNHCTSDASIAVGDFIRKGGGSDDPFTAGRSACSATPGKSCSISLRVKDDAGVRTYSYSVSINGTKQDPDLIIEG